MLTDAQFTAQQGVSTASTGHVADHNEIVATVKEIIAALNSTPVGRRNVIRNGDMGVAQRGDGSFTANSIYTVDGWRKEHTGGTHTVSRGGALPSYRKILTTSVASQSAVGDYAFVEQRIEDATQLAGKEVTLSFVASATSGTPKIALEFRQNFGTGGSPSTDTSLSVGTVTISTTLTRYTMTFTVPSITGKTFGTSGTDHLVVRLWTSAGSNFAVQSSSIGIQNATINLTDVQLEQGGATAFERLSHQEQTAWCQRYFWRYTGTNTIGPAVGVSYATTDQFFVLRLPVTMRGVPGSVTLSAASTFMVLTAGASANATGVAANAGQRTTEAIEISTTTSALGVSGGAVWLRCNGTLTVDVSAEL